MVSVRAYERQRNHQQLIMGIIITVSALIALALGTYVYRKYNHEFLYYV